MASSPCRRAAALLLATAGSCILAQVPAPAVPPNPWEAEIRHYEAQDRRQLPPSDAILFVGSSTFAWWPTLEQDFRPLVAIRRGFGGSQVADALHFADRIIVPYRPRILVLYAGSNDLAAGKSPEQVCDDFRRLVEHVQQALPACRVVFLSPRPSRAREVLTPEELRLQRLALALAERTPRVGFLDVRPPLTDGDGRARTDLLGEDGLHLNAAGYRVLLATLKSYLGELDRNPDAPLLPSPLGRLQATLAFERPLFRGRTTRLDLPLTNRAGAPLHLRLAWRFPPGSGGRVAPAEPADVTLAAGETRTLAFDVHVDAAAPLPPVLDWRATLGPDHVAGHVAPLLMAAAGYAAGTGPDTVPPRAELPLQIAFPFQVRRFTGDWQGPADCSGALGLWHGGRDLRILAEVRDDVFVSEGDQPWNKDAIELLFDFRPEQERFRMRQGPGCLQVIAVPAPAGSGPGELVFVHPGGTGPVPGAELRSERTPTGYRIDLRLPWAGLRTVCPGAAESPGFHFSWSIDDTDVPGPIKQQLRWAGAGADHQVPGLWGAALPEPAHADAGALPGGLTRQ